MSAFTFQDAAEIVSPLLPLARDNPPWTDCGDPRSPDFGTLFATAGAGNAVVLSFDREGLRHALTLFSRHQLGREIELYGRRFPVNTDALPTAGQRSPAPDAA